MSTRLSGRLADRNHAKSPTSSDSPALLSSFLLIHQSSSAGIGIILFFHPQYLWRGVFSLAALIPPSPLLAPVLFARITMDGSNDSVRSRHNAHQATYYFPHFLTTMIIIYFLGNGAVSMTLILCLTAIAGAIILRDTLSMSTIPDYLEFGSQSEIKAYQEGYKKGYADAGREYGPMVFRQQIMRTHSDPLSGPGTPGLGVGRRLMGPPVVGKYS